jgi:hypothetical protein
MKVEIKKAHIKVKLLEENLSQVRDENAQVKHQLKTVKETSEDPSLATTKFLREYEVFKRETNGKLETIAQYINTQKKTPKKDEEKKKQLPINKTVSQQQRKPQLNNRDMDVKRYCESLSSISDQELSLE